MASITIPIILGHVFRAVNRVGHHEITRDNVKTWLKSQDTFTLHHPVRRNFPRRTLYVSMMDEMWECDLIVMEDWSKYNDGYRYMLVVIDVLSRYLMV